MSNMLAANPRALVFSESRPPVDALFHCPRCPDDQARSDLFRAVIHLMGSSSSSSSSSLSATANTTMTTTTTTTTPRIHSHDYLFFKFQSIVAQKMSLVLSAFPDVPWVFLYRAPVQTLMSHLDPTKGGNNKPPCLKSRKRPTEQVRQTRSVSSFLASCRISPILCSVSTVPHCHLYRHHLNHPPTRSFPSTHPFTSSTLLVFPFLTQPTPSHSSHTPHQPFFPRLPPPGGDE